MKSSIANVWKNVDYLKYFNFSSLMRICNDSGTWGIWEITSTTGDEKMGDAAYKTLDADTEEDMVEAHE